MTFDPISIARALLPTQLVGFLDKLAEATRAKLQGETLRAVMYGAAGAVWVATRIADLLVPGHLPIVSIDQAMIVVTVAVGIVTELARRWVYSPATVAAIVATPPIAAGPINAAAAAGVPVEVLGQAIVAAPEPAAIPDADVLARLEELAPIEGDDSLSGGA